MNVPEVVFKVGDSQSKWLQYADYHRLLFSYIKQFLKVGAC